jgi:hypothetical protein
MKLDPTQIRALQSLVGQTPFADIANALVGVEIVLGLATEATREAFWLWEEQADAAGYADEFALDSAQIEAMSDEWRLAYIARLLRTVALDVGIGTEFGGLVGARRNDPGTLAPLLRNLLEIASRSTDCLADASNEEEA